MELLFHFGDREDLCSFFSHWDHLWLIFQSLVIPEWNCIFECAVLKLVLFLLLYVVEVILLKIVGPRTSMLVLPSPALLGE